MKSKALKFTLFLALLLIGSVHEYISCQISEKGFYKGSVIDKADSGTHYLYVNWDGIGAQTVVTDPMTYKRTYIGDRYETQYEYAPLLGAIGKVYNPSTHVPVFFLALLGVFSKIGVVVMLVNFVVALRQKSVDVRAPCKTIDITEIVSSNMHLLPDDIRKAIQRGSTIECTLLLKPIIRNSRKQPQAQHPESPLASMGSRQ